MKFVLTLSEGLKDEVIFQTDDRNEAEDMLDQKWKEIRGEQWLRLTDGISSATRSAIIDKPLDQWEQDRIEMLKVSGGFDTKRNGDRTLLARGLIEEVEINNRTNVLLVDRV